jgi:hypothetical protein
MKLFQTFWSTLQSPFTGLHSSDRPWKHRLEWLSLLGSYTHFMLDFRFSSRFKWDLCYSVILRSVDWLLITDVSGHPIFPIFKCQAVQEELGLLRNIQEEWRSAFLYHNYLKLNIYVEIWFAHSYTVQVISFSDLVIIYWCHCAKDYHLRTCK